MNAGQIKNCDYHLVSFFESYLAIVKNDLSRLVGLTELILPVRYFHETADIWSGITA